MYWAPEIFALVACLTPGWGYLLDPPWVFFWIAIGFLWHEVFQ